MKKLLLSLAVILVLTLAACSGDENGDKKEESQNSNDQEVTKQVDDDKTVAKVNGEELKGEEFNLIYQQFSSRLQGQDVSEEQLEKRALDQFVGQELVLQAAEKNGLEATEKEINEMLNQQYKSQYDSDEAFQKDLEKNNLTEEDIKSNIADQLAFSKYVEENTEVSEPTEEEIQKAFEQIKKSSEEDVKLKDVKQMIVSTIKQQKQQEEVQKLFDQLREDNEVEILL
ncbi:hypothetical protein GCM10008986_28560 [Salinibacillus aidingensis]|uniref:Peptidylprolyl isomerase n=1 Tax=Salinibacillus aidingensis TaxID=237684 RepID=A0ABN1BK11_9BACI